ncbi:MAG: hypothetical protein M3310_08565 [Actinomycetota bacterium]|nr:hypothetical protein [Actinomycetota bacterium]
MTGRSEFSEQEWEALRKGVTGAGLLVSASDRGFFDAFKEAGALARHLAEARQNSSSGVVRELAQERGTGFGIGSSPDDIERETLASLRSAVAVLESKAPDEIDEYREFVLEVAESVARAAGGGEVAETQALEKIRSALGRDVEPGAA